MLCVFKTSASEIFLSMKEELLSVCVCRRTHIPVKTVLLKMQILLALEACQKLSQRYLSGD